jgi:hypothetical protein
MPDGLQAGPEPSGGESVSVHGIMRRVGGMAGFPSVGLRGRVCFEAQDGTATETVTGPDGRFTIEVPPGRYKVSGKPDGWGGGDWPKCFAWGDPIDVPADGLDDVDVICNVR